jgi:hypothetical protein
MGKSKKMHNGPMVEQRASFRVRGCSILIASCSLLRGNKNVFKWIFTEPRWTRKQRLLFLKEEVIVAMLKIICYQCRLIAASRLEFSAHLEIFLHAVLQKTNQQERD